MDDMLIEYILTQDEDGHWFVIPANKEEEWSEYLDKVYSEDLSEDAPIIVQPDWVDEVGGAPSRVKFMGYVIE